MSTLILYSTKSGASQKCAGLLANKIADCVVCDIKNSTFKIETFDTIIVGTGVRMGKLYKPVISFIRENTNLLLSKQFALYLCNAYPDTLQKVIEKNVPEALRGNVISFGGVPPFSKPTDNTWMNTNVMDELVKRIGVTG